MESSITLLHLGPPNSVEVDVLEYPAEKYPELAASLHQPNDVAGAPTRLTQLPATITCVRVRFQNRELASQIQTLQSLLDEKEEKLQEARWKEESHAEVLQDWMLQMRELEKANGDLQEQAAKASRDFQEQVDDAERLQQSVQAQIRILETELGTSRRNAELVEAERSALQKRLHELQGQIQELAEAFSATRRHMRSMEQAADSSQSERTVSNAPIPKPPHRPDSDRPLTLEYETLKSSLSHSQRTAQSLRTNMHREKTEKSELKRMLQDARDELESQPASRIHDIEFAVEISTSLIEQVRNLQALLAEKEDELKEVKTDRSRLELEVEGFQRLVVDNAGLTERRKAMRNPSIGGRITPSLPRKSEVSPVNPGAQSTSNYGSSDWASDEEQSDVQSNVQPDVHTAAEITLPDTLLGRDS